MPKFELKRRSYDPDKLDKENYVVIENYVAIEKTVSQHSFSSFYVVTKKTIAIEKLCCDRKKLSRHSFSSFSIAIEKTVSRQKNYVATEKTVS